MSPATITEEEAAQMAAEQAAQEEAQRNAAPEPDPETLAAGGATIPKDGAQPTPYVVLCVLEKTDAEPFPGAPAHSVPFIVGGWEEPEVFETRGGGAGAKRACLDAHPELAACVREPGLSLATWPARSYGFKRVEFEAQPDKLVV